MRFPLRRRDEDDEDDIVPVPDETLDTEDIDDHIYTRDDDEGNSVDDAAYAADRDGHVNYDENEEGTVDRAAFELGQPSETNSLLSLLRSQMGGDHSTLDLYKKHLMSMPDRSQFKPTFGRKLLAAFAGAGEGYFRGADKGIKTAQSVRDEPFERTLLDWHRKGEGLGKAATIDEASHSRDISNVLRASDIYRKDEYGKKRLGMLDEQGRRRDKARSEHDKEMENVGRRNAAAHETAANAAKTRAEKGSQRIQTPGQQASDEAKLKDLAFQQTLEEYPEFRKHLDKSGGIIRPTSEADRMSLTNLYRIASGKVEELKKKYATKGK